MIKIHGLVAGVIWSVACVAAAAPPLRMSLRPEIWVQGPRWSLADAIDGSAVAADMHKFHEVVLTSPQPGLPDVYSPAQLESVIRSRSDRAQLVINWVGAEQLRVNRSAQSIQGAKLVNAAIDAWMAIESGRERNAIDVVGPVPDIDVPQGDYRLRARSLTRQKGSTQAVWIDVAINGHIVRSVSINLREGGRHSVWLAKKALTPGAQLLREDFILGQVEGTPLEAVTSNAWPEAQRLRRPLRAGEVLTAAALAPIGLVQRGDPVRLLIREHGMIIEAQGVATSDAVPGQWLAVQWAQASGLVHGRLLGNNTVSVE